MRFALVRLARAGRRASGDGRVPTTRNRFGSVALWVVWLASRVDLYLVVTAPHNNADVGIYQRWYECCLSHGSFPLADPMWQYPPGAGLVLWLAGRLAGSYVSDFVLLAIGCDLGITLMLRARARRRGSAAGAWLWVCGVPLLGTVAVSRLDVVPVALSVAAVCWAGRGGVRGLLIGAGAAIKIWPVLVLAGTPPVPPGRLRRDLAATAVVFTAVCAGFPSATGSFLAHQAQRGVEIESVVATPWMIWRAVSSAGNAVFKFGSYQFSGGHAVIALDVSRLALVLVAAAVLGWRLLAGSGRARWRPEFAADAPLAATLLFLVASPVLSPQYLLWPLGLAAACLASGCTTQRSVALAVLAAAGLTQLIFPIGWQGLLSGSGAVTAALTARNLLLVGAAVVSCRRILTMTPPVDETQPRLRKSWPLAFAALSPRWAGSGSRTGARRRSPTNAGQADSGAGPQVPRTPPPRGR